MEDAKSKEPMMEEGRVEVREPEGSRCQNCLRKTLNWCKTNLLLVLTIVGVFVGTILGLCLRLTDPSADAIMLVNFPGDLLMRMLKMLIIPLVVSSMIAGLARLDARAFGKLGSRVLLYYFSTTVLAAILGIILVIVIHPGDPKLRAADGQPYDADIDTTQNLNTLDAFLDVIRNLIPENLFQACFMNQKTIYKDVPIKPAPNITGNLSVEVLEILDTIVEYTLNVTNGTGTPAPGFKRTKKLVFSNGPNVLGIIAFCIAFGVIVSKLGERARVMVDFFCELNEVIMRLVHIIMWYSPFGIMCLIAGKLMAIKDMVAVAKQLGMYMVTVITGLTIHATITLPLIYFVCTRKNPLWFLRGMLQAWITALGTASSAATLPISLQCLEENLGIDSRVTRFAIPIGATVNMDGTALYEAVATIFIAQMNGVELNVGQVITISLTSMLASIGAASIPGTGIVMMLMVLGSVGLPVKDVSLILAVDWLLDRIRTSINVLGDGYGAAIVAHISRDELAAMDVKEEHKHDHDDIPLEEVQTSNDRGHKDEENANTKTTHGHKNGADWL